jgi:hypothetical protein
LVGAIDDQLNAARSRGDEAAVERLEIQLNAKMAEVRQVVRDAEEIEEIMSRRASSTASKTSTPPKKKRWWQLG